MGTHHSEVPCGRSIGVGSAVMRAIAPTEVSPDLCRGVPETKHVNTYKFIRFCVRQGENISHYTSIPCLYVWAIRWLTFV